MTRTERYTMKPRLGLCVCLVVLLGPGGGSAQEGPEIPIRVERLSERVLLVQSSFGVNTVALASDSGIVVTDTNLTEEIGLRIRETIERELGRSDFRYVINTHCHRDHAGGNRAFPEADRIGNAGFEQDATGFANNPAVGTGRLTEIIEERETALGSPGLSPSEARDLESANARAREAIARSQARTEPPILLPTRTFDDTLTLELGDLTVRLYTMGPAHSASDIYIHVPEEGLLLVGDQSGHVRVRPEASDRLDSWIGHLDEVLAHPGGLRFVVPGHGEVQDRELAVELRRRLIEVWSRTEGKASAVLALVRTREAEGMEEALARYRRLSVDSASVYFFDPGQLYELAWEIAREEYRAEEGTELYRLATQEFPEYITENPSRHATIGSLANFLFDMGVLTGREAMAMHRLSLEVLPDSPESHFFVAGLHERLGDVESARQSARRALEIDPEHEGARELLNRVGSRPPGAVDRGAQSGPVRVHRGSPDDVREHLHREIAPGEAVVWYLGHSGWAIRTARHFLTFDYWEWEPLRRGASLANGRIAPEEIRDQDVYVFVSHEHLDHFDRRILQWEDALDRITYLFGWEAGLSPEHIEFGTERDTVRVGDMEVYTIHHDFDGIPESAFLVRVDDLTIYHSGDHGNGSGPLRPRFVSNMEYLARLTDETDLMFLPLFGWEKFQVDALNPHVLFPMHARSAEETFRELVDRAEGEGWQLPIACAEQRGDWFLYRDGRIL